MLSSDSACLSDAVYLVMSAGTAIHSAELKDFDQLFDSELMLEHQLAEFNCKRLWEGRADHLTGFSHLALLLDPRRKYRDFVQGEVQIIGEGKNVGNTPFLSSADTCLRGMADIVLPDNHKTVVERSKGSPELSLTEVKQALLTGALKAFVGAHKKKGVASLGIDEDKLKQFGVSMDGEAPVQFWEQDVPAKYMLREAAMRVLSAKPSSTAVERLWNAFGDNLTAKRRSMKNSTLATLVYAKMNMHLLDP